MGVRMMSGEDAVTRWWVVWSWGGPDAIAKAGIASLVVLLVACVVAGWAFGAGLLGFGLGFLLTVFAFTSNHFRLRQSGRTERP